MELYNKMFNAVDALRPMICDAGDWLWKHPETGYREVQSSKYLAEQYEALGYKLTFAGNVPGFYTTLDTGKPGPTLLLFSELDSLICADHPDANPETGAVHACGHSAQGAALLGLAAALKQEGVLDGLCGKIKLCIVPAEELLETGFRETLRQQGIIKYFGGKVEFMRRGYFDDCDISFMLHTSGGKNNFSINKGNIGCITKNIAYKGVASHAGGSPHAGVNALYAANLGLNAMNALRETFIDSDHIRVHPIITKGGNAVNAIPNDVTLESYVRGNTIEAIMKVNKKCNRALAGTALAMGGNVSLCDRPGYMPLINDVNLNKVAEKAFKMVVGDENVSVSDGVGTGCTDMGDMSAVMPSVHPHVGGAAGTGHGNDYRIADPDSAYLNSAKAQLAMIRILLENDAAEAKRVIAEKKLRYNSFEEYFKVMDSLTLDIAEAVKYLEDGNAQLTFC
nr:amidohydrolase [Clostridia bacterium]